MKINFRALGFTLFLAFIFGGGHLLASSQTSNLKLNKPGKGDRNWGQTINDNMDKLDAAYGNFNSVADDMPEVYVYTGTFNSTTGYQITLPKAVDNVNEYAVKVTPTSRSGAIGDIYVTKTTSNFTVKCSEANTTDTFTASLYYIGNVSAYGGAIYRKWYVSPDTGITDHGDSSQTGSLAWVQAQISTTPAAVELVGNKNYQLKQNLTVADNIQLIFQKGGIIDTDFSIRDSNYEWYLSGSGTSEYYLQASGGGNPNVNQPSVAIENNSQMTEGNAGSLSAGEWDWTDNDGLGYATIYVRLNDSTDPDTKSADYVEAGYKLTFNGQPLMGRQQVFAGEGNVVFSAGIVDTFFAEWWQKNSTPGTTDMTYAIQAALTAAENIGGGIVRGGPTIYYISGHVTMGDGVRFLGSGDAWYGSTSGRPGRDGTVIINGGPDYAIKVMGESGYGFEIAHMHIYCDTTNSGIYMVASGGSVPRSASIHDLSIQRVGGIGLKLADYSYLNVRNININLASGVAATGIKLGEGSLIREFLRLENVNVQGQSVAGSKGLNIVSTTNCYFTNLDINDCDIGIYMNGLVFDLFFKNTNISRSLSYNIELYAQNDFIANVVFRDTTINFLGSSSAERGFYFHKSGSYTVLETLVDYADFRIDSATNPTYIIESVDCAPGKFLNLKNGTTGVVTCSSAANVKFSFTDFDEAGLSYQSGDNSTTTFTVTISSNSPFPYKPFIAHAILLTSDSPIAYTTNIVNTQGGNLQLVVTFASAPSTGSNNILIYWNVTGSNTHG